MSVGKLGFTIVARITADGFELLADNFFVAAARQRAQDETLHVTVAA